jgi:hypothetical protein
LPVRAMLKTKWEAAKSNRNQGLLKTGG